MKPSRKVNEMVSRKKKISEAKFYRKWWKSQREAGKDPRTWYENPKQLGINYGKFLRRK
jgi:hypothetical protein